MNAEKYSLPNGLQVIFVDSQAFPSISTLLLVGAGSRYEQETNNGIAHFFEHMAFKGSKKYPSSLLIASTIESFGGVFNAFTSKDYTGYWIKAPSQHFEASVDVIADMIQSSLLDPAEIEREKGVIVEELNMYEDSPQRKVTELFENLLYKGNPLGFDIGGTPGTVMKFTKKTFTDYMAKLYSPTNAILLVAGGLEKKVEYKKIIEDRFSNWKHFSTIGYDSVSETQSEPAVLLHHNKKYEQAHMCIGFRAFSFMDNRQYALTVLAGILGKGMSSRLFMNVREREGLCYYIYTYDDLYSDVGNMVTHAGIAKDPEKVKKAISIILKEHKAMKEGDISPDELHRAKEIIKGRLILSLEDSFNLAHYYGKQQLLEKRIETPEQYMDKIERVSIGDVVAVAKELFVPKNLNLAIIGPFENKKEFEGMLTV
jgi:predicted Zn-dependent peptidase